MQEQESKVEVENNLIFMLYLIIIVPLKIIVNTSKSKASLYGFILPPDL